MTLPPTDPSTPYSAIRPNLQTGDLFFLYSHSPAGVAIENVEKALNWPPYSHVGMVINDRGSLYFLDAPGSGDCFPDPYADDPDNRIHGTPVHGGLRVSVLDDVLAYYSNFTTVGGFWLRQLTPVVISESDRFGALRLFINRVDGLPFPEGSFGDPEVSGIAANWGAGQLKSSVLFGTYFCAQLVADAYMHMGLLTMEVFPPNGYSPAAFGMADYSERLPLVKPASLSDPQFIKWDGPSGQGQPCPS
jgi:hypothetical protein